MNQYGDINKNKIETNVSRFEVLLAALGLSVVAGFSGGRRHRVRYYLTAACPHISRNGSCFRGRGSPVES